VPVADKAGGVSERIRGAQQLVEGGVIGQVHGVAERVEPAQEVPAVIVLIDDGEVSRVRGAHGMIPHVVRDARRAPERVAGRSDLACIVEERVRRVAERVGGADRAG
jgi:hypothetical protein